MIKFLSRSSQSITGAALVISAATLISRIVGMIRDRVFAHEFGSGAVIDAYQAAFRIPDLMYNLLIVGALTAGFVPVFTKLYLSDKPEKAWHMANNVLNICVTALVVICIAGMALARPLSHIVAPGFSKEKQDLVVTFLRIILLSPILLGISTIIGGILQSFRQFLVYSLAPIFYNVGIIIGATVLFPTIGISGLAWGVVVGALLHLLVQLYGAYTRGYRWQGVFDLRDKDSNELGRLMIPRTLGLAFSQLSLTIITILGSTLSGDGNIGALNYASNLQGVPLGLIGAPFALAVFPVLSAAVAGKNMDEFKNHLSTTLRQILFLIIPTAALFGILSIQLIRVIYGTGEFDWEDTILTGEALKFFAIGIVAQSILPLLGRAFYALSDTKTPFMTGAVAEVITIIFALVLIYPRFGIMHRFGLSGVAGLALASSLGVVANIVFLFIFLRKKIHGMEDKKLFFLLVRILIATFVMGVAAQYMKTPIASLVDMTKGWGILIQGFGAGIVGILVYLALCWLMRVEELSQFITSLKKRWLKVKNVSGSIDEGQAL